MRECVGPPRRAVWEDKAEAKKTMKRTVSIRKRLERLEAGRQKQADTAGREAFIVRGAFDGERHLEMTSSPDARRCWFEEMPGPGKQLADFGEFAFVLELTEDEANA
jgi:hypothetical protein